MTNTLDWTEPVTGAQALLRTTRREYSEGTPFQSDLDPIEQFRRWYSEAKSSGILEPNAASLATSTADGIPSVRIVLIKDVDARGFTFYTNYDSRKAHEINQNPRAALAIYWDLLERQVRVTGHVSKVSLDESRSYFSTRPRGAQISAWASAQSHIINSREELLTRYNEIRSRFEGQEIQLPPNWGGYCLSPNQIEFWLGRKDRLHERYSYTRQDDRWELSLLAP